MTETKSIRIATKLLAAEQVLGMAQQFHDRIYAECPDDAYLSTARGLRKLCRDDAAYCASWLERHFGCEEGDAVLALQTAMDKSADPEEQAQLMVTELAKLRRPAGPLLSTLLNLPLRLLRGALTPAH
jgi:hypothetical protein